MAETKNALIPQVTQSLDIEFDKKDIVTVAVANAEKHIKDKIRLLKSQIDLDKKEITDLNDQIEKDGLELLESKSKTILEKIKKGVKAMAVASLKVEAVNTVGNFNVEHSHNTPNSYEISIAFEKDGKITKSLRLAAASFTPTAKQIALKKKINALEKKIDEMTDEAVSYRRKLADIPALERQMTAHIVRQNISKTEAGKQLLEIMSKELDESINLIGE